MTIDQFLSYLQYERNRSERTVKAYGDDLRSFEAFFKNLDDQLSWESVDSDVIRSWMESMMDKGNTATSINRRLSAVRSLYRFALSRGIVERDPAHGLKGPKGKKLLPQYLRESEMDRLLADDMWTDEMGDLRARTIILMFYSTGIRLSELTGLDNASVDFAAQQLKVRGKGNKERLIPFGSELQKALRLYTERRDAETPSDSQAFFVGDDGQRMTSQQVRQIVQHHLSRVTTMKKRSPHVLRHTFATAMLNNEAGIESVKKLLGHSKLSTTEIYTHTTFEQLRRAYAKAHPREV
ncbi:MAG: tyrosine recombinase XerC [Prevotella sp.]|jgi:integrase/recombinase XerC|nr:tyrosine recombinase XerC [Prevotella sp.]